MKIEGIIAIICLIAFLLFNDNIEILKTAGIFAIASYTGQILDEIGRSR